VPNMRFWEWSSAYAELEAWRDQVRDLDVSREIAQGLRDSGDGTVVVLGSGAHLPETGPARLVLADFDREHLDRALAGGRLTGYHALGLRLPVEDQSADTVIITSRLAGIWETWGEYIIAEAMRIGGKVRTFFDDRH
jgi:validoxylamine A glucosyltransferase